MTAWDHSVDLLIVGSGGGGLTAALCGREAGADVLVIEKRELLGGSTAMSGGVIWIPNNPLMQEDGVADSNELGMTYFDAVVGDVGPTSSVERRRAFIEQGSATIRFLTKLGVTFLRCDGYSDYYDNRPGGNAPGRALETRPIEERELGAWASRIQPGMGAGMGMMVKTNEVRSLPNFNRSARAFVVTARVWLRTKIRRAARRTILTNGAALIARLVKTAVDRGVDIWTAASFDDFVVDSGRIVGARVRRGGEDLLVQARRGVIVASGGFAHNAEMRKEFSGDQPVTGEYSWANPGDTGEVLAAAMSLGAKTDLMDEAWWLPTPSFEAGMGGSTLLLARQRPGAIMVDAQGRRFVNEANSYVEVVKAMFERDKVASAAPCWLIFDDGYRRRYVHTRGKLPGRLDPSWIESGAMKRADTLEALAAVCGIDPDGLAENVARFNVAAAKGADPEFHRGESAYNRCLGDPGHKINPALGPLDKAPFYAIQHFPADVGTCGGLLTDAQARVLDQAEKPIPGLYATGNSTATVMGRSYPGAGASIANTMVFGYIAAHSAMASAEDPGELQPATA
jgi:3-oxosteroid 1-dehydrogenase